MLQKLHCVVLIVVELVIAAFGVIEWKFNNEPLWGSSDLYCKKFAFYSRSQQTMYFALFLLL